ncbi:MAG TPA: Type 1 glutamine amidotransferase-like domain-containing protein, partial [Spirochaetota bacterium]|nr:Type 1 glutamine amidotransferase-like domain-containing protein [Spirochaetota bacterium]
MKKLFLSSSFADVVKLFPDFSKEDLKGKTITFIPTASIPEKVKFYVAADKKALQKMGIIIDELELTKSSFEDISNKLNKNDYIYISGGNTFFLLQELIKTGTDKLIIEQINKGKIYIGASAGSIILSPNIEYVKDMDDCSKAPELNDYSSLSIVDFYPVPHHTNAPFKKAVEKIITKYESKLKLVPISNSQTITVDNNKMKIENV